MDRSLYVSMTGAAETMRAQAVHANNLANASTPGFKADLQQFRSMPVYGDIFPSRVFAAAESPGHNFDPGGLKVTGNDLDVAIKGDGWFVVETSQGDIGLSRRGDLQIDVDGFLVNGAGQYIQSDAGRVEVGNAAKVEIGNSGQINVIQDLSQPTNLTLIGTLLLVNPNVDNLEKKEHGLFVTKNGEDAEVDASVRVASGVLEDSNVNPVSELIDILTLARTHELDIKMMDAAKQNDESSTKVISIG